MDIAIKRVKNENILNRTDVNDDVENKFKCIFEPINKAIRLKNI